MHRAGKFGTNLRDPFYTTKGIGQGTGPGLAVSRQALEERGGAIEAENNADGGASLTIYLPINKEI